MDQLIMFANEILKNFRMKLKLKWTSALLAKHQVEFAPTNGRQKKIDG